MKRIKKHLFIFSFFTLVLASCKNDDAIINDRVKEDGLSHTEKNNRVYSLDEAKELAADFFSNLSDTNIELKSGGESALSNTYTIKALDSINLYVFNYKRGGFVIINPIKRINSRVLAFSEKNNISTKDLNSGAFSLWKDYTMECLLKQEITNQNTPKLRYLVNRPFPKHIEELLKIRVGALTAVQRREILNYLHYTDIEQIHTKPIIKTKWHQHKPYNNNCPHNSPAGCVAISVGQILNYYKKWDGESWDWNKINNSESPDISQFIRSIGRGVKMTYHEGGSHPDWKNLNFLTNLNYREISFLKKIGYNAKSYNLPNKTYILIDELKEKRPVIMCGFKCQFIIPKDGHSWIADGYKTLTYAYIMNESQAAYKGVDFRLIAYNDIPVRYLLDEYTNDYFHFNFGWGGTNNTWFLYNYVNFESIDFDTHLKIVTIQKK